jgi:hypothetical protein
MDEHHELTLFEVVAAAVSAAVVGVPVLVRAVDDLVKRPKRED